MSATCVQMALRKWRSCEMVTSTPSYSHKKLSSQRIESRSRLLVGSSSSNTSGLPNSACARSTRKRNPPASSRIGRSSASAGMPRPDSSTAASDSAL